MTKIQMNESVATIEDRLQLTMTCLSELRGAYPDIALPEDIDRTALGEEAFFVTLPIGQAGARSRNQRTYSRAAVEQMVTQINQQRPEGMWGHLAPDESQTRYDPPAIRWLAATIDGDGIAWGKGLPLTDDTREYYRLAKATNARVGTSLVAWAQMDGDQVKALELITVDLADPARVGVPVTAARPVISKEMAEKEQIEPPSRQDRQENGDVGAAHVPPPQEQVMSQLAEMLGAGDVVEQVQALIDERAALIDAAITAAVKEAVKLQAAQALVAELVRGRDPQTQAEIAQVVAEIVAGESVQAILREGLQAAMGPSQRRPVIREGGEGQFFSF